MPGTVIPEFTMADRLRKARESTGLDRQAFAEQLGVSRNTVTSAESGKRRPMPLVLRAWADYTGVPAEWIQTGLYTPRDSNPEPAGLGDFVADLHILAA